MKRSSFRYRGVLRLLPLLVSELATAQADKYHFLGEIIHDLRGEDDRLIRWDADEHTAGRQLHGGCDRLRDVLSVLTDEAAPEEAKATACEAATLCVTDNPQNRAKLSHHYGIHEAVLSLVSSSDPHASAAASHLIYIAAFANTKNHQAFADAGAVAELSGVIKKPENVAVQIMWAAAALQNLAASYCDTGEDDGRCYWDWPDDGEGGHVEIMSESLPLVSDGSKVRREMVKDTALMLRLVEMACKYGPVRGEPDKDNPYPGETAIQTIAGKDGHESHSNILPWAAAGALKNGALEPSAREFVDPDHMHCICRLSRSLDWLEENKGEGLLHHLRRDDPCWFDDAGLCVDLVFMDADGDTCSDYEDDPSEDDCEIKDPQTGVSAGTACCACGGGMPENEKDEMDDGSQEL